MSRKLSFLKVSGRDILNGKGKKIYLRGANLGAWLMMEGYFLHGRNFSEHIFKREFARANGLKELKNFERLYRNNFIVYQDIQRIKRMGANCLRVPFNYRLVEKEKNWHYIDKIVKWCKKEDIWCILDLHAAPGAQNIDWHSDSEGVARLWRGKEFQRRYLSVWRRVASRYRNETTIAGYDVLNEPVPENPKILPEFYKRVTEEIRKVEKNHILFLEAHNYGQQLDVLGKPKGENIAYSIHVYQPINFTFNFQPHLRYPGIINGKYWDKKRIHNYISRYHKLAKMWQVPILVGEFGINYRCPKCYGELRYLKDVLDCFQKFNFHWTYWSYKAVAGGLYPDGIWQYLPNSAWIKREGPIMGWENFYHLWKKHKNRIAASWKTENFTENKNITALLAKYFLQR